MKKAICIVLFVPALLACCQSGDDIGLITTLVIEKPDGKDRETWHITVTLKNSSTEPVVLSDKMSRRADLASALKDSFSFSTDPHVYKLAAQTAQGRPNESALTYTLEAGKELVLEWDVPNTEIRTPWDYAETTFGPLRFPADGDYKVTAEAFVETNKGKVQLRSKELNIVVGPEDKALPALEGRIVASDEKAETAELDIGAGTGVREGDVYWRMPSMADPSVWELTVTSAGKAHSFCSVKMYPVHLQEKPEFPKKDQQVVRGVPQKKGE